MTLLLTSALYLSAAIFLAGIVWRLFSWATTPAPLDIALAPKSKTGFAVIGRLAGEMFAFRSLFKADALLWIQSWLFHITLLLLFFGHLGGLVVPDFAPSALGLDEKQFHRLALVSGGMFGLLALYSILGLLARRLVAERVRWISTFGDYFVLTLLLLIVMTGNQMRFMNNFDLAQARQFVSGWLSFHPAAAPASSWFTAHLLLVSALLVYAPFSKLVHLCGAALFSPTLSQLHTSRESATA